MSRRERVVTSADRAPTRDRGSWAGAAGALVELPGTPQSVAVARHSVAELLSSHGLDQAIDTAVLLTSELVTNAVVHAQSTVRLHAAIQADVLRVEAHDRSRRQPVRRAATADGVDHRGLAIVAALADQWGYAEQDGGKYVWFELSI